MSAPLRPDTRTLLRIGGGTLFIGVLAALLMLSVFGGVTHAGPHTPMGWLALIVAMGCLPTGALTLLLGVSKLIGDRSRKHSS